MNSKLMVGSELGNIENQFYPCMSSNNMESILERPSIYPKFQEPTPVSAAPSQHLKSEDADAMDSEISESGWTMYLDECADSWSDKYTASQVDIEQQQKKRSKLTEAAERYRIYDCWVSGITGNDQDESSMASDASSGPQKLPLPVQDNEFENGGRQTAGSYYSVVRRKRDGDVDKGEDSECVASCSLVDVILAPGKNKFRRLNNGEHHELLVEDTATSSVFCPQPRGGGRE